MIRLSDNCIQFSGPIHKAFLKLEMSHAKRLPFGIQF